MSGHVLASGHVPVNRGKVATTGECRGGYTQRADHSNGQASDRAADPRAPAFRQPFHLMLFSFLLRPGVGTTGDDELQRLNETEAGVPLALAQSRRGTCTHTPTLRLPRLTASHCSASGRNRWTLSSDSPEPAHDRRGDRAPPRRHALGDRARGRPRWWVEHRSGPRPARQPLSSPSGRAPVRPFLAANALFRPPSSGATGSSTTTASLCSSDCRCFRHRSRWRQPR
jgi:hypothetical protein